MTTLAQTVAQLSAQGGKPGQTALPAARPRPGLPAKSGVGQAGGTSSSTSSGSAGSVTVLASEVLPAGRYVNLWSSGGTVQARLASAAYGSPRPAHGYVLADVGADGVATVYQDGVNTLRTSGAYLSATTPGATTDTPPSGSAGPDGPWDLVQRLDTATIYPPTGLTEADYAARTWHPDLVITSSDGLFEEVRKRPKSIMLTDATGTPVRITLDIPE